MTLSEGTIQYQYRGLSFSLRMSLDEGQEVIRATLDDVVNGEGRSLSEPGLLKSEYITHVVQFASDEWRGKPLAEFERAYNTTRVTPDDGAVYLGDGYYVQRPGSPENLMGPFDSRALATNMATGYALSVLYDTKFPEPTMRFRHSNGHEYTVIGVSNLHSDKPEHPPSVFYQGDNGRMWDKPLEEFMRKMKLIASATPEPVVSPTGAVLAPFTDAHGRVCSLREAQRPGIIYLYSAAQLPDTITGKPDEGLIAFDAVRVKYLMSYLLYFLQTGELPERALSAEYLLEPIDAELLDYQRLQAVVGAPETRDFWAGVLTETAYQTLRWESEDATKSVAEFAFLVGALLGKAIEAHKQDDGARFAKHCIAAASSICRMFHQFRFSNSVQSNGEDKEAAS